MLRNIDQHLQTRVREHELFLGKEFVREPLVERLFCLLAGETERGKVRGGYKRGYVDQQLEGDRK